MKDKIQTDMVLAMKAGERAKVECLRMVLSAIKYGETSVPKVDVEKAIRSYKRKLSDSMESFKDHPVTLAKLAAELRFIDAYLPQGPAEADLKAFIQTLDKSQAFGALMKEAKTKFPIADGKLLSELVKTHISSN